MLIIPRTEFIKGNFLSFERYIYKNHHIDVLEYENQIYARLIGFKEWLKFDDVSDVKESLIKSVKDK